jgi:hypothetical protein
MAVVLARMASCTLLAVLCIRFWGALIGKSQMRARIRFIVSSREQKHLRDTKQAGSLLSTNLVGLRLKTSGLCC